MSKIQKECKPIKIEDYRIAKEPYYIPHANEVEVFTAAYKNRLPVMLKGPTLR